MGSDGAPRLIPRARASRTWREGLGGQVASRARASRTQERGAGGRAARCARAPRTQDLLVPGLGGWSARWTRAVKASPAARPPEKLKWMVCRVPVAEFHATGDDARSLRPPALLPAKRRTRR